MDTSTTENDVVIEPNEGEGESSVDTVAVPKSDYEKLNQTLGSLKRELKDLKKSKEEDKETPQETKSDDVLLQKIERMSLRQAGIDHSDDIELARNTAKKWNVDIDEVLADEDFKVKLERQQTARANVQATSGVKGGVGTAQAKNTPEYWVAKGTPPSPSDVPDRKTRAKIVRAMMASAKDTKKFYNE